MTFRSRRLEFTAETKREALKRSGGICECHLAPQLKRPNGCGVRLVSGAVFYEHIVQCAVRPDNSLSNAAVLCRTCWREKTAKIDLPVIAKSKRVYDRHWATGNGPLEVIVGSRSSPWKHKFNGGWERR